MKTLIAVTATDSGGFQLELHWLVILVLFIALLVVSLYKYSRFGKSTYLELTEAEFGTDGVKGKYKVNTQDQQVGYMFWVEVSTRKIGLPIDEKHDVIVEIYDSWYEFFKVSRELIKSIPANKVQDNESTRQLVRVTVHILNSDIRQHLTQWQAKYRRWWEAASVNPIYSSLSPQEIQQMYPQYHELIKDMKFVNAKLIGYKNLLKNMVVGAEPL